MDVQALRYFLAVAREGNVSRAAELLHVTQPTLSRQIANLEKDLGIQLFSRGKSLILTEAGYQLRSRAEEVTHLMDRIEKDFNPTEQVSGTISIGSGGLLSLMSLSGILEEFRSRYPAVRYEFYANSAEHVKSRLDRGLLDFGLLLEPVEIDKYSYIRMQEKERWGILMSKGHPLACKSCIHRDDLSNIPIMTTNRPSLQGELANWFDCEWEDLNIFATYNIITNALMVVERGSAVALTIEGAVSMLDAKRVVFKPLEPELSLTSVLAWKKKDHPGGAAARFLDYFRTIHKTNN